MDAPSEPRREPPPCVSVGGFVAAPGVRIPLFGRMTFDLELIASRSSRSVVAARRVPADVGGQGLLLVQLHENAMAASRRATVRVLSEAPSRDAPSVDFVASVDEAAVQFDDTAPFATVRTAALLPGFSHALRVVVDLHNGSGSSTGGGTIELSADLYLRPGAPSLPRRILPFVFNSTVDTEVFVPFVGDPETAFPPGVRQTFIAPGSGRVERVGFRPTTGSLFAATTVGVHLNDGATAVASEQKFTPSATLTWFSPSPLVKFAAGDRVHVSVNPGVAPGDVVGTVVLRMDGVCDR